MVEEYDFLFKCVVLGDGGVGKTALTLRFSKGFFTEDYKMTIGVDFHVKTIAVNTEEGELKAKLQIWDTGGQERFSSIRPMYYKGALGGLLIFDVTSYESFQHLPNWIEEIRANTNIVIPLLLVGNKSDLEDQRAVFAEEINDFTRKFNLYYMETSAKTGDGVGDCFYILACLMIGKGVPERLIAESTVFGPGNIITATSPGVPEPEISHAEPQYTEPLRVEPAAPLMAEPEPASDYMQSPVPEPFKKVPQEPTYTEPEPEQTYFSTNPSPVENVSPPPSNYFYTSKEAPSNEMPALNPPPAPKIERSFDEFLGKTSTQDITPPPRPPQPTQGESYKPKVIPFSSKTPTPVPPPKAFHKPTIEESPVKEPEVAAPFILPKRETPTETRTPSTPFTGFPTAPISESSETTPEDASEELSKKERKKLEKRKKKEKTKENISGEEEITSPSFFAAIQKPVEEKEQMAEEGAPKSNLFETLSKKSETSIPSKETAPAPFGFLEKAASPKTSETFSSVKKEGSSIPSTFASLGAQKKAEEKNKDIVICRNCGAILSKEYAFCNKCGSALR